MVTAVGKQICDEKIESHFRCKYRQEFKDPLTGTYSNTIKGFWCSKKLNIYYKIE